MAASRLRTALVLSVTLAVRLDLMPNGNKTMIFNQGFQESKPKFETDPSGVVIRWTF